jgi:dihydroxyacetone kinase-like protein
MHMKKFINRPERVVPELLEGFALAFPRKVRLVGSNIVARTVSKPADLVRIVTLGGSGHEPGLSGFVGHGMLDFSVAGEIFAAPGPPRCVEAIKLAHGKAGVLLIVLNHAGDVLSANMTMDLVKKEGLHVEMVLTQEDIAGGADPKDRRGLVGFLPVYKVAGAAAERGESLMECARIAQKMADNMRTLGVAVRTATHPSTGQPIFQLGDDEMEIGMGQHGEAGTGRMQLKTADQTAQVMMEMLLDDLKVSSHQELLVILNGSGATTLMELFIVFRKVAEILDAKRIKLVRSTVGEYITAQEQAGFQLMIAKMDAELIDLWDAPCDTPFFTVQ